MNLERLAIRLRPRSDWEAIDLGFAMVRAWWRPLYAAWLLAAAPIAITLVLLFGGWGFLIFWWTLALFEIAALTLLARAVFGETPSPLEIVRATPREATRFLAEATWRRFDLQRSFHLPVGLLERSSGSVRKTRLKVLALSRSDSASWLSFSFFLFALSLAAGLVAGIVMLTPPWLGVDWNLIEQQMDVGEAPWAWKGLFLAWTLALLLVDPIYIACGFCLYLGRRTTLEGWDLEIALRTLARRLRRGASRRSKLTTPTSAASSPVAGTTSSLSSILMVGTLLGILSLHVPGASVHAEQPALTPEQAIEEVMELEELQTEIKVERWQLSSKIDLDQPLETSAPSPPGASIFSAIGQLFEILLWVGLVVLVLLMGREIWRGAPRVRRSERVHIAAPERIAGLDVRRESLPADVASAAATLWREGQGLEALGLLYRASLSRLHGEGVELRESFTESDCLAAARRHLTSERSRFFTALTEAWQTGAYAHRLPSEEQASQLIADWPRHIDVQSSAYSNAQLSGPAGPEPSTA